MNFKDALWRSKAFLFFLLTAKNNKDAWLNNLYYPIKKNCKELSIEEKVREIYLYWRRNNKQIEFQDPGSYGRVVRSTVREVFKRTTKPLRQACRIAHLAQIIQARQILELGTAFGTTSLIFKLLNPESKVVTVEGVKELSALAQHTFKQYGVDVELLNMLFIEAIGLFENEKKSFDFIFLDGHHEPNSSEKYINRLAHLMSEKSILIIDDIFYNKSMQLWWKSYFPDPFSIKVTTWDAGILIKNRDCSQKRHFYWKILL